MGVNIFAIWRLSCGKRHAEKHCFHKLLLSLSICDLTHLIFTLFCFCLPRISETYDKEYNLFVLPYLIPLAQMSLCSSCFTTGQFQMRPKDFVQPGSYFQGKLKFVFISFSRILPLNEFFFVAKSFQILNFTLC